MKLSAVTLAVLICLTTVAPASGQRFMVTPLIGGSPDGAPVIGAAASVRFRYLQPEVEFGWVREGIERPRDLPLLIDRSADPGAEYLPAVVSNVWTLMLKSLVPIRVHRHLEPYGVIGIGLARATRKPPAGESLERSDNQVGFEVGGGATIWVTERLGIRGSATYFKVIGPPGNFHGPLHPGAPPTQRIYTNILRDVALPRLTFGVSLGL